MRHLLLAALLAAGPGALQAAGDQLTDARKFYNQGDYAAAMQLASQAVLDPTLADGARVLLGRSYLERFRQSANPGDLTAARDALRRANPQALAYNDRLDLMIGQAETLFLEDRFGAAAELFETTLDRSAAFGVAAHERVLDWWATALDRHARTRPPEDRRALFLRILERMRAEAAVDAGSRAAWYWQAAATRETGDLERAWQLAMAGWVRAPLGLDHGEALRADLEQLVTEAIIPERAARLFSEDPLAAEEGMLNEWEAFKAGWVR
jgi:hypothetical protein